MTHDEAFAEFRARREQERAAQVKVTWRKVSPMTGGGYSGLGPDGVLVFVRRPRTPRWDGAKYEYGTVDGKTRVLQGGATTLHAAKAAAAALFTEPTGKCERCGTVQPLDADGRVRAHKAPRARTFCAGGGARPRKQ